MLSSPHALSLTRLPHSGRNLFFSTDVKKHIAEADVVFVRRVPRPTQPHASWAAAAPDCR
jgi:hypothetical protein